MAKASYRIVCGVDGSASADRAVDFVSTLPLRPGDEVVVASRPPYFLAARPGDGGIVARASARARERALAAVDRAVARLARRGVTARGVIAEGEDAVDALIRVVEREDAAILIVGSRGQGPWTSVLLGSTARALAVISPVPVLVVRGEPRSPARVIVATDGSPAARAALAAFARMPQREGSSLELLQVLPVHDWGAGDDETWGLRESVESVEKLSALEVLTEQARLAPAGLEVRSRVERGHAGETILARATATQADLIVIGSRGAGEARQLFWGSTAERVLTQARCNVLVAPVPRG